jgi:hypothetical protein
VGFSQLGIYDILHDNAPTFRAITFTAQESVTFTAKWKEPDLESYTFSCNIVNAAETSRNNVNHFLMSNLLNYNIILVD